MNQLSANPLRKRTDTFVRSSLSVSALEQNGGVGRGFTRKLYQKIIWSNEKHYKNQYLIQRVDLDHL